MSSPAWRSFSSTLAWNSFSALPVTHLPLIFSEPSSDIFCHLSISDLAAGRSAAGGLLSMNFCQRVTAAMGTSTRSALALVAAKSPEATDGAAVEAPGVDGVAAAAAAPVTYFFTSVLGTIWEVPSD